MASHRSFTSTPSSRTSTLNNPSSQTPPIRQFREHSYYETQILQYRHTFNLRKQVFSNALDSLAKDEAQNEITLVHLKFVQIRAIIDGSNPEKPELPIGTKRNNKIDPTMKKLRDKAVNCREYCKGLEWLYEYRLNQVKRLYTDWFFYDQETRKIQETIRVFEALLELAKQETERATMAALRAAGIASRR